MSVPYWQPGTLYQPGEIVQANDVGPIVYVAITNADFELGTDWVLGTDFTIATGQAFDGTDRLLYSGQQALLLAFCNAGVTDQTQVTAARESTYSLSTQAVGCDRMAGSPTLLVAIGDGACFTSTNGTTWTTRTQTWASVDLEGITYDPNTGWFFVWERESNTYHTSADGISWFSRTFPVTGTNSTSVILRTMANNGVLTVVACSGNDVIYSTTDGVNWTLRDTGTLTNAYTNVVYSELLQKFYAFDTGNLVMTSSNGEDWVIENGANLSLLAISSISSVAWSPVAEVFCVNENSGFTNGASTDTIATSPDGITWTLRSAFHGNWLRWSNTLQQFVSFENHTNRGRLNTSDDGITWTQDEYETAVGIIQTDFPSADLTAPNTIQTAISSDRATVRAGQALNIRVQATLDGYISTAQVGLSWYDGSNVLIKTDYGTPLVIDSSNYVEISLDGVAPRGAVTVAATCGASGPNQVQFDAIIWDYYSQPARAEFIYQATQVDAGYSGSNEPVFPVVISNTVVDNDITWTAIFANKIVWQAFPILVSGSSEPTFPTAIGETVVDNLIIWITESSRVQDENCPNTKEVAILASKIFAADKDIIAFSATVNPLDWTATGDAGYIPFGLNTYGSQDVSALAIYRSNLVAFNDKAFQMWQVDEDPNNFAILDAIPIGCPYYKSLAPVSNDLVFLTEEGIRSMGIAGASTNLQAGFFGKQIDPLVLAAIKGGEVPDALYFPGAGQYWLFFGEEAFVLTMNGGKADMSWSRYVFPSAIDDWTIGTSKLYLRSGDKVWLVDDDTLIDDSGGANVTFEGHVWWPYLDFGALGQTKALIGFDVVADGTYTVSIGYNQKDATEFTTPYQIVGDTLPGDIIPLPVSAPSLQMRLVFAGNEAWEWSATALYLQDFRKTS